MQASVLQEGFATLVTERWSLVMALVHLVDSRAAADVLACEVPSRAAADLLVCKVGSRAPAQGDDGLWCFVDSRAAASSLVHMVPSRAAADLLICYVDSRAASGWTTEHRLKGKL
jgi:hypothetical protein